MALIVFGAGAVTIAELWSEHRRSVEGRRQTAFETGPFRHPDWLKPYFARLPTPAVLGANGLRFIAKPELEDITYAAALRQNGWRGPADVELLLIRERPEVRAQVARYRCRLQPLSYQTMIAAIDAEARDFGGSSETGTDGTSLGFERIRGSRLTAGGGNFIQPYRSLGEIVLARLREACPAAPLPEVGEDWYRRET